MTAAKTQDVVKNVCKQDIYTQVRFTNETFNKPPVDKESPSFWEALKSQSHLIEEELKELIEGLHKKDMKEVRDAVADILVVTLGVAHLADLDVSADMAEVTSSNLSKVCPTAEDAVATQHFYFDKKGVKTKRVECATMPGYVILVDGDQTGSDGKFYPANKFLKSVGNFKEPVFVK